MSLIVECHSGYRGEEEPRRFRTPAGTVEVGEILDRWRAPDHRGWRIRGDDGGLYSLRHFEAADRWEMERIRDG